MKRRTFLLGTVAGVSVLALSSCFPEKPAPTTTPSTPTETASGIPQPSAFERTSWGEDPFSRGSVSFQAVGSTPEQRIALRQPVDDRIFFAGEHTDDLTPGTVQGAERSGRRAATEVAAAGSPGERIAVVGAGMAGATAARDLKDAGFSVVVIEARDRAGGRLHTIDTKEWPFPVELGAAWVEDASVNSLAADLAALEVDAQPFDFRYEQRTTTGDVVEPKPVGPDAVLKAIDWAALQPADVSVADALAGSGAADLSTDPGPAGVSDAERLATYIATDVVTDSGAPTTVLSAWYAGNPTRSPEDDRFVSGGYQKLVTSALEGLDVLPSSSVSNITSTDRGISLRMGRGESLSVDRVVVTVPLGVLQHSDIEFDPPLPFDHRGAISALGMGIIDKVVLRFDKPFWSTDATVWTVIGGPEADATPTPTPSPGPTSATEPEPGPLFPLWFNLEPQTGEPVLVGVIGGTRAKRIARLSDDEVVRAALTSLTPFLDEEALAAKPTPSPTPTGTPAP